MTTKRTIAYLFILAAAFFASPEGAPRVFAAFPEDVGDYSTLVDGTSEISQSAGNVITPTIDTNSSATTGYMCADMSGGVHGSLTDVGAVQCFTQNVNPYHSVYNWPTDLDAAAHHPYNWLYSGEYLFVVSDDSFATWEYWCASVGGSDGDGKGYLIACPSGVLTPEVHINTPADTSTVADFGNFNITWSNTGETFVKTSVQYSQDAALLADCLEYPYGPTAGYTDCPAPDFYQDIGAGYSGGIADGATVVVPKTHPFNIGETWYARVVLLDNQPIGENLLYGDIISFTIGTPSEGPSPVPGSCGTLDIACYIKQAFGWFFTISPATLNQFHSLTLEDSIPFSYLYDIGNLYNELFANGGSMAYAVSVSTGSLGNFDLISASQISAVPYASTIKTILGYLLYFFTGMTLYRMLLRSHSAVH